MPSIYNRISLPKAGVALELGSTRIYHHSGTIFVNSHFSHGGETNFVTRISSLQFGLHLVLNFGSSFHHHQLQLLQLLVSLGKQGRNVRGPDIPSFMLEEGVLMIGQLWTALVMRCGSDGLMYLRRRSKSTPSDPAYHGGQAI